MQLASCVFLCAVNIFYQQCFGLNFIDLPGFGSGERSDEVVPKIKQSIKAYSDGNDSDKKEQNKEQILESRKNYVQQDGPSDSYPPKAVTENQEPFPTVSPSTTTAIRKKLVSAKNQKQEITASPPGDVKNSLGKPNTQINNFGTESTIYEDIKTKKSRRQYPPIRSPSTANYRRKWFVSAARQLDDNPPGDDKDENIKSKISMLVQQTMHDTEARIKTVQKLKERHREEAAYRVGFILSMIKKSRDVLNELFNVAVKHRDEWKALEQLKIFELIVHTNVDTTNLVRQLVEMHIHSLNNTAHTDHTTDHSSSDHTSTSTTSGTNSPSPSARYHKFLKRSGIELTTPRMVPLKKSMSDTITNQFFKAQEDPNSKRII